MANIKRSVLIAMLCLPLFVLAADLSQVELNDDNYLLLSVKIDKKSARLTVDSYEQYGQLFVAIEPLLNGVKLRYQLREDQLTVWKGEESFVFRLLTSKGDPSNASNSWGTDGYYQFISQSVLEELFDVNFEMNKPKLSLTINTNSYTFPITKLAEQADTRSINQAYAYNFERRADGKLKLPITIPDQYKLFTLPHGDVTTSMDFSDNEEKIRTRVQLVSDLFYHSARISLNNELGNDITGGLTFSRYKTTPDDRLLGVFDQYRFGDISSSLGAGIIGGTSGVGVLFERMPDGYRRSNSKIDIEQDATPGWDAELFLNGRFIAAVTVPETGLLIFEDVDIYYGANEFQIKVYGPFAEVETYQKSYPLIANPLADNEMAYNIHALDNSRSLFNNSNEAGGLSINSIGGSFDYGVNDTWQVGVTFQDRGDLDKNQQFFSLHNYVNLPGFLLESQLAFNADSDFAQETTLSGNLFGGAAFQLKYDSNNNLGIPNSRSLLSNDYQRLTASYFNYWGNLPLTFRMSYGDVQGNRVYSFSNNIFYNYKRLRFSHDLTYSKLEQSQGEQTLDTDSLLGNFGVSGSPFKDFRLSAQLIYNPDAPDIILNSSFIRAQYRWRDPFSYQHYFNFNYRPIADQNNEWQFSHSLAYETSDYRLSFNSSYDAQDRWSVGLNVNFFLGYDYHNNRALTSSSISADSAMLNIHSYLDRQLNGMPDVLDYDLEGVTFSGRPEWEGLTSGKEGRVILPGVPVNTPVRFGATWKNGSKTINNDYVIYTHPGAVIDVNMPFYLNFELAGFVYRSAENGEVPVSNLVIELLDKDNNVLQKISTDSDGYFEFTDIKPNSYTVAISAKDLQDKGLTTELKGYSFTTPSIGGFIELPVLLLRQLKSDDDSSAEAISEIILDEDNVELLIWDENAEKRQNYFTLPTKQKIMAPHSQNVAIKKPNITPDSATNGSAEVDTVPVVMSKSASMIIDNPNINPTNNNALLSAGFTLQLGAFMSFDTAQALSERFSSRTPTKAKIIKTQNNKWQTIYKVYLGAFAQRAEANAYIKRYQLNASEYMITTILQGEEMVDPVSDKKVVEVAALPMDSPVREPIVVSTSDALPELNSDYQSKAWVIQFYASQSAIDTKEVLPFAAIGDVFMAQKEGKQAGEIWYCLISNGFDTRTQAQQALQDANVGGWVNQSQLYSAAVTLK